MPGIVLKVETVQDLLYELGMNNGFTNFSHEIFSFEAAEVLVFRYQE